MKNLILTASIICLSVFISQAQDTTSTKQNKQKQENLFIEVKEGSNPDVYIDGKKYDYTILDLIDQSKIDLISIIQGDQAIKEYNAPNGVLIIKTKEKKESKNVKLKNKDKDIKKDPKVIIDGKVSNQKALKKLSPRDIHSIDVLKGEEAINKYNASNGVIIITTNKGKK